jgi:butyryl-CoA dehydrogenase
VQDAVRSLRAGRDRAARRRLGQEHQFPAAQLKGLAALGCYGVAVPTEWDGAGLDYLALALILEEIAAGDGATSTVVSVNNCPCVQHPDGLRQRRPEGALPQAAGARRHAGRLLPDRAACGLSEAGGLKTTAVRDGDHYVLNGVKQFITSGKNGDVAIVMAVTDKAAGKKGISAFLVPTATPGYTVARVEDKMGQHASDTAQILFDNCRVPAANLLGDEGMGLKIALSGLEGGRIGIASQAWAWRARPSTPRWPTARSAELRPADLPAPGGAVQAGRDGHADRGRAAADLARRQPEGRRPPCLKEAAMAKLFASEMAERVCSAAIQVFGGYGYVSDFPVERIYRDVRVCQIYEGTSEVQKILIGRALA